MIRLKGEATGNVVEAVSTCARSWKYQEADRAGLLRSPRR